MKERPLPLSGPEVRAILENRKTQVRRPLRDVTMEQLARIVRGECACRR